ncbi:hypothetical protein D3C73_1239430 [compost metagenome]
MLIQVGKNLAVDFRIGHNQEAGIVSLYGIDICLADIGGQLAVFVFTAPFVDAACRPSQTVSAQRGCISGFDAGRGLCVNIALIHNQGDHACLNTRA